MGKIKVCRMLPPFKGINLSLIRKKQCQVYFLSSKNENSYILWQNQKFAMKTFKRFFLTF